LNFFLEGIVLCHSTTSHLNLGLKCWTQLVYAKVHAHWVPQMLPYAYKEARAAITTDRFHQYDTGGEGLLSQIFFSDETFHHFDATSEI
jgi:hypothetical protein